MAVQRTPEQEAVVKNRGGALLVSAAAGSGKTRVLVERLLDRILNEGKNIVQMRHKEACFCRFTEPDDNGRTPFVLYGNFREGHLVPDNIEVLDLLDYLSNYILMPVVAIGTCLLVGWVAKPETIVQEATKNGETFGRKSLYIVMVKYVTPVLLFILFLRSLGVQI